MGCMVHSCNHTQQLHIYLLIELSPKDSSKGLLTHHLLSWLQLTKNRTVTSHSDISLWNQKSMFEQAGLIHAFFSLPNLPPLKWKERNDNAFIGQGGYT